MLKNSAWRLKSQLALCLATSAFMAGCSSGTSSGIFLTTARVMNGLVVTPGTTNVDVYSQGALLAGNLPIGGVSPYGALQASNVLITVNAAGTQNTLFAAPVPVSTRLTYTLAIAGVNGAADSTKPQILPFVDQIPSGLASNASTMTALRVVNLSPDSSPIDVYNNVTPIIGLTNISYSNSSGYVLVTPVNGAMTMILHTSGMQDVIPAATLAQPITLTAGKAYTMFLIGVKTPATGTNQPQFDARISLDN